MKFDGQPVTATLSPSPSLAICAWVYAPRTPTFGWSEGACAMRVRSQRSVPGVSVMSTSADGACAPRPMPTTGSPKASIRSARLPRSVCAPSWLASGSRRMSAAARTSVTGVLHWENTTPLVWLASPYRKARLPVFPPVSSKWVEVSFRNRSSMRADPASITGRRMTSPCRTQIRASLPFGPRAADLKRRTRPVASRPTDPPRRGRGHRYRQRASCPLTPRRCRRFDAAGG